MFTLIVFIIVLSLLIFVHEAGHFWAARKMGVKVEEFGFGLPPRLFGALKFRGEKRMPLAGEDKVKISEGPDGMTNVHKEITEIGVVKKVKRWKFFWGEPSFAKATEGELNEMEGLIPDDTIYSINWLPLGGFCKIKGENGEGETDEDSFVAKKIWKRIIIISAGVIMNVVLAAVLLGIGYMVGLPQTVENTGGAIVSERKIMIVQVLPDTPAFQAGLQAGDVVESINGRIFAADAELQNYNNTHAGQELNYKISREGKEFDLKITPNDNNGKGEIGIAIVNTGLVRYPWYLALWKGAETAILLLWVIIVAFYELLKNLFLGHGISVDVAGPVGIATMTGQYARMGFVYLLQFVALLSLNLAVINFLPFPALDGGRVIFLLIEKIKGSPVKREVEAAIHNIGFLLLIGLIILITFKDVYRFCEPIRLLWNKIF